MPENNNLQAIQKLLVTRTMIIPAMNLGTEETPDWAVCGDGWTKFSESPNAQTESVKYINMESETTDTTSYSPKYSFECDLMASERSIKKVYDIAKGRKTGSECVLPFLIIDKFDRVGAENENKFVAWYEKLAVAVSSIDGEKKMKMSGDLNSQGDTVKGTATIDKSGNITFTPDNEASAANAETPAKE